MKQCTKCKGWKLPEDFSPDRRHTDGLQSWCKACLNRQRREVRAGTYQYQQREAIPEGFRRCTKCNEIKPLANFSQSCGGRDGLRSWCKICVAEYDYQYNVGHRKEKAEYDRRRRREDPEGDIERKRRWGQDNPERIAAKNSRRRARKAGARGSHTIEEFEALCEQRGWACLCCGIPHSTSPLTRDHIVPLSRGGSDYISNIQPLCLRCNDRKGIKIIDYRQDSGMIVLPDF